MNSERTLESIETLRKEYMSNKDAINTLLGLLAATAAAALAIPGIETTHWIVRALWLSSVLQSISGAAVGGLTSGLFYLFFDEDIAQLQLPKPTEALCLLTLETVEGAELLQIVDKLFWKPSFAIVRSAMLFAAGAFAFVVTVDFGKQPRSYASRWPLAVVALGPSAIFLAEFWLLMLWCSVKHRRFRLQASGGRGPGSEA
ncbi:hypothetical protein F5148DRAFT_1266982 [Russula earlei]|uniref:Uncharacterized protein n=1 Tax=Russula earlei TaxID=71964 RepID=A0ACC0TS87_9AGAM|nr:hypothetical protein F5148DRAFT_1266982 [Russula earlei]